MDGLLDTAPADRRIAAVAARQHGVVARAQLRALGLERGAIEHRLRAGRLSGVHRGVYAVGHARLTPQGWWMAAVLAYGKGAVLSHRTAAAHWGLRASAARLIEVSIPSRAGCVGRRGINLHRSSTLSSMEVTEHEGIPVTTPARTLIDLAGVVPSRALRRALDEAERLRLFDLHALEAVIASHLGHRGAGVLAAVLLEHDVGTTLTRSELEERFLVLCDAHDLPRPAVNALLGRYEVDFLWRAERLIVETDGRASHATRAAFERDRARDARLTVAGYRVVRLTYRQVVAEPAAAAELMTRLLRPRRSSLRPRRSS